MPTCKVSLLTISAFDRSLHFAVMKRPAQEALVSMGEGCNTTPPSAKRLK